MNATLHDKVALVTGAGQGIGREVAITLAECGIKVALNDINEEKARLAVSEISAASGCAITACCDVSNSKAVQAMVAHVLKEFGRLDILVNNARPTPPCPAGLSLEDWWDRVINVALKGAYLCSVAALEPMERQRYGRVINISSIHALAGHADPEWFAYSSAKAGMIGLTRSLAQRGLEYGITSNAILPGYIESETVVQRWTSEQIAAYRDSVPLRIVGRPSDIAEAVIFLANSRYITGELLFITGGRFVLP